MRHLTTSGCKLFNVVEVELASSTRKDESESRLDYPIREALEKFSPVIGLSSRDSPKSVTSMLVPQNEDLEFVLSYYDPIKLKNGEDYFTLVERLCSHWSWKITCLSSRTCSSPAKNYSSGKLMSWT